MFKVNNKDTRTTSQWCDVPLVDFKQVNVNWISLKWVQS